MSKDFFKAKHFSNLIHVLVKLDIITWEGEDYYTNFALIKANGEVLSWNDVGRFVETYHKL